MIMPGRNCYYGVASYMNGDLEKSQEIFENNDGTSSPAARKSDFAGQCRGEMEAYLNNMLGKGRSG